MLRENKMIFGLMVCFIGGLKLGMQGLFFDEYVSTIIQSEFVVPKSFCIFLGLFAIFSLISIVKDEVEQVFGKVNMNESKSEINVSQTTGRFGEMSQSMQTSYPPRFRQQS